MLVPVNEHGHCASASWRHRAFALTRFSSSTCARFVNSPTSTDGGASPITIRRAMIEKAGARLRRVDDATHTPVVPGLSGALDSERPHAFVCTNM